SNASGDRQLCMSVIWGTFPPFRGAFLQGRQGRGLVAASPTGWRRWPRPRVMNGAMQLPLSAGDQTFLAAGECLVRRTVLASGVRILTEQVPAARSATIGFCVAVGSRDEHADGVGSTHFLEHLLFKGTTRRTALDIA